MRQSRSVLDDPSDLLILPTLPSVPIGISGDVAELWLRLADTGVDDSTLSEGERALIYEFEEFGIASQDPDHPARMLGVRQPWLTSPLHELVYSLIANLAQEAKVDIIFLKGPVLNSQGLRTRPHSGDVDVWVNPVYLSRLASRIETWGWETLPEIWHGTDVNHSETLAPTIWGCEIDLHRRFPGSSHSDSRAFQVLRELTTTHEFAGTMVDVPIPEAHRVILALHTIRPVFGCPTPESHIDSASKTLQAGGTSALSIAQRLRVTAALHKPLRQAFPEQVAYNADPIPLNWEWLGKRSKFAGYMSALSQVPFRKRLSIVWRMFWPSQNVIFVSDRLAGGRSKNIFQARWRRFSRGISGILRTSRKR